MTQDAKENHWWDGLKADDTLNAGDEIKAAFDTEPMDMHRISQLWCLLCLLGRFIEMDDFLKHVETYIPQDCKGSTYSTSDWYAKIKSILDELEALKPTLSDGCENYATLNESVKSLDSRLEECIANIQMQILKRNTEDKPGIVLHRSP